MARHTTIRLPDDLLRQAKRKAAEEGRTFTSLIVESLRERLQRPSATPMREPVMPRVSKATGGLFPGLDPKAIQEEEDIEYIRKMSKS
ncbi:MAG TPA: YlcI/YnfO family protein [Rhodoblastus sp.]|mgnify:CR=1 FL=1|nr:YlcI/YnfO family protein [Rhodoblastus sp.]